MNQLEALIRLGETPAYSCKPFSQWKGAAADKVFTLHLLTSGETEEVLRAVSNVPVMAAAERSVKEILARAIQSVDGSPAATDDDLKRYNESHKSSLSMLEYKLMLLDQCQPIVIQALNEAYNKAAAEQQQALFGEVKNLQPTPAPEPSGKSDSK